MAWNIRFDESGKILQVSCQGKFDSDLIRRLSIEVMDAVKIHQAERVLLDHREVRPEIATTDIYYLPRLYREHGLDPRVRVAVVIHPASDKKADYEFYETVVHNTGYPIRVFTDIVDASRWLATGHPARA